MSSFKHKANRAKFTTDVQTVDEIHSTQMKNFRQQKKSVPSLRKRLKKCTEQLNKLEKCGKVYTPKEIKLRSSLRESIKKLKKEIVRLNNNTDVMEYYSKTGDVLREYYTGAEGSYYNGIIDEDIDKDRDKDKDKDTDRDKDKDNDDDPTSSASSKSPSLHNSSHNSLHSSAHDTATNSAHNSSSSGAKNTLSSRLEELHQISKKKKKLKKKSKKRGNKPVKKKGVSIVCCLTGDNNDQEEIISHQATLQNIYRSLVDANHNRKADCDDYIEKCPTCEEDMILLQREGMLVCKDCGISKYIIIESEIPSHVDAINEKPKYPYKKINHLIEKINQFQSKETNNIPDAVFDTIDTEIKKYRLKKKKVTMGFIKKVLKKYKYHQYYENRQYIFSKITHTPPPILTREQEEEIKRRFRMLEEPYMKFRPSDRSNFLNYSFVLNKILKIMELHNHAKYFLLLKSPEKLKVQEKIWEKICNYLDWPYHSNKENNIVYKMKFDMI